MSEPIHYGKYFSSHDRASEWGEFTIFSMTTSGATHDTIFKIKSAEVTMRNANGSTTDTTNSQVQRRLNACMQALLPGLMELRQAIEASLQDNQGANVDNSGVVSANQRFFISWLMDRTQKAFEIICRLPPSEMAAAAAAFKPTGDDSFIEDLATNGHIVRLISKERLTNELCIKAVSTSPLALCLLDESMRTPEVCLAAVSVKNAACCALQFVPEEYRTKDLCRIAVNSEGANISHIPMHILTQEHCILACIQSGLNWDKTPAAHRTLEVEFAASMHGFSERTTQMIFNEVAAATSTEEATEMADRCEELYIARHHSHLGEIELEDVGLVGASSRRREAELG